MANTSSARPPRRPIIESRAILLELMRRPGGMSEAEGSAVLGWKRCDGTIGEVWHEAIAAGLNVKRWKAEDNKTRFAVLSGSSEAVVKPTPKAKLHRTGLDKTMLRVEPKHEPEIVSSLATDRDVASAKPDRISNKKPKADQAAKTTPAKRAPSSIRQAIISLCGRETGASGKELAQATNAPRANWKELLEAAAKATGQDFAVRKIGRETRYFLLTGEPTPDAMDDVNYVGHPSHY